MLAILDHVYESDEPVPWRELLNEHSTSGRWSWRTVEGTVYDLVAFGALHRIGRPGTRTTPDTRALRPTPLGRAWLEQRLEALPGTE